MTCDQTPLVTLRRASELTGIPYRAILAEANSETIPTYQIGKSHRRVNPVELVSLIRKGGSHESGQ